MTTPEPPPLPRCTCPYQQDYHEDDCPHYLELLARIRAHQQRKIPKEPY
jgi:hypothetical protein